MHVKTKTDNHFVLIDRLKDPFLRRSISLPFLCIVFVSDSEFTPSIFPNFNNAHNSFFLARHC